MGLMAAKLWAVKQKPEKEQVGNEGDPDPFTAQGTRALVFEPVDQV